MYIRRFARYSAAMERLMHQRNEPSLAKVRGYAVDVTFLQIVDKDAFGEVVHVDVGS
jgi:hypothetical protein